MNDILIHAEYELKSGWRYRKRPGLKTFLHELAPFYEIVIFTTETGFNAQPVVSALDPRGEAIFYALFRDSTTYAKGKHIKDLNNLNRDLRQVIALDVDPASGERNKQNVLILQRWEGNTADRELYDLIPFLKSMYVYICLSVCLSVRPCLSQYDIQMFIGPVGYLLIFSSNNLNMLLHITNESPIHPPDSSLSSGQDANVPSNVCLHSSVFFE
jgi:import inner membrane translocase subunit TIM50